MQVTGAIMGGPQQQQQQQQQQPQQQQSIIAGSGNGPITMNNINNNNSNISNNNNNNNNNTSVSGNQNSTAVAAASAAALGPTHLVALYVATAGQQGNALGSDEEEITLLSYVLVDALQNKVSAPAPKFSPLQYHIFLKRTQRTRSSRNFPEFPLCEE
ncbi:hypothetical protein TKK_0008261 [Trichogramma kaykai]